MAQASATKHQNSFVNGLITDGSEFAAPENALRDMLNVEITKDGEAHRRKGLTLEGLSGAGNGATGVIPEEFVIAFHYFEKHVDGFDVIFGQVGDKLVAWSNQGGAVLSTAISQSMSSYGGTHTTRWDIVRGPKNTVYVFLGTGDMCVVQYSLTPSIAVTQIPMLIRDLEGLDDGQAVDQHAVALTNDHDYNLQNQGWKAADIAAHFAAVGTYPTNAEIWWQGRTAAGAYATATLHQQEFGTTPAPRGRHIFDITNQNRTSIVAGSTNYTIANDGPSSGAFYAGRVWAAGLGAVVTGAPSTVNYKNRVYFSQITDRAYNPNGHRTDQSMYQINDPTTEFDFEVIATDGGWITLPEVEDIYRMIPVGHALLVFADSGVYAIDGGLNQSFSPTQYAVNKVSDLQLSSAGAVVKTPTGVYFWAGKRIYVLAEGASAPGVLSVGSVVENRIENYLDDLPSYSQDYVEGRYVEHENKIYWSFPTQYLTGYATPVAFAKDTTLVQNLETGAFFPYYHPEEGDITAGLNHVFVHWINNRDNVFSMVADIDSSGSPYAVTIDAGVATATDFLDFGAEPDAYLETWPDHMGDPRLDKSNTYVHTYFERTEDNWIDNGSGGLILDNQSGCLMRGKWDWHTSDQGRWSAQKQVYRYQRLTVPSVAGPVVYGGSIIYNKSQVRGHGRALSLRFDKEAGKDFKLKGWSLTLKAGVGE